MTTSFILDQLPRRMAELGYGENFRTKMQTLVIPAGATKQFRWYNVRAFFPAENLPRTGKSIMIESDFGVWESSGKFSRLQHEHTGKVTITNFQTTPVMLTVILAIPYEADAGSQTLTIAN